MTTYSEDAAIEAEAERFLYAEYHLGADVEDFINSDVGRFMAGRATQTIADAVRQLLTCDLGRELHRAQKLQADAKQAKQAFTWMLEAVSNGRAAETRIRQLDAESPLT